MKITQTIAKRLPDTPPVRRARRDQPGATSTPSPTGCASTSTASTACCTRSASPRRGRSTSSRAPWEDVVDGAARLGVLAEIPCRCGAAADGRGRQRRRSHLRRAVRLAGLRLDGRGQGGLRVDQPLPRPRPRAQGDPLNLVAAGPIRTTAAKSIPGFERVRGRLGRPRAAGLGRQRPGARPPRPAWRCCPTGSRPRPARSCTSTAACTRWGSDAPPAGRSRRFLAHASRGD